MALFYLFILCMFVVQHASKQGIAVAEELLNNNNELQNSGSGENEISGNDTKFETTFTSTSQENQMGETSKISTPSSEITGSAEMENSTLDNDKYSSMFFTTSHRTAISDVDELNSEYTESIFTSTEVPVTTVSARLENSTLDNDQYSSMVFTTSHRTAISDVDELNSEYTESIFTSTEVPVTTVSERDRASNDSKLLIENIKVNFTNNKCAEISWFYKREVDCFIVQVNDDPEMKITSANSHVTNKTKSCKLKRGKAIIIRFSSCSGKQVQEQTNWIFTEPPMPKIIGYFKNNSILKWKKNGGRVTFFELVMKSKLSTWEKKFQTKNTEYILNDTIPGDTIETTIAAVVNYKRNNTGYIYSKNDTYEFTVEPNSPRSIKTRFLNTTCLEVAWNSGHVCRDNYILDVNGKISNISIMKGCEITNYTEMICELNPDEKQNIKIQTFSNGMIKRVTKICPARCPIYATSITSRSITISCRNQDISNNTTSKYFLDVDGRTEKFLSLPHVIDGLLPGKDHLIRVIVEADNCNSTMSNDTIRTFDAQSGKVQNLTLKFDKEDMHIMVSWLEPKQTNGNILQYRVQLVDDPGSKSNVTYLYTRFKVQYGKTYHVRITPVNGAGDGVSATETIKIIDGFSSPVQNLALEFGNDSMMLMVTWEEPIQPNGNVSEYKIYLDDVASSESIIRTSGGFYTQISVNYGASYNVTVIPKNRAGLGEPKSDTIKIPDGISSPVQNLALEFRNGSMMLMVTWEEPIQPNGNVSEYRIYLDDVASSDSFIRRSDGFYTKFLVNYGTSYNVTVIPVNGAGFGEPKSETIKIPAGKSGQVQNLRTKFDERKMALLVTWEEALQTYGKITEYKVWLKDMNDQIILINLTSTKEIEFAVMHGVCYNIEVAPVNEAGEGQAANLFIQIPDGLPGPVRDVTVSQVASKHAALRWKAPAVSNGTIIHYYINASGRPTDTVQVKLSCDSTCYKYCGNGNGVFKPNPDNNAFIVNQDSFGVNLTLLAYTNYTVTIQPLTNAGGGQIETVHFRTSEEVPNEPKNIHVENVTASSLVVVWEKPDRYNGNTFFQVHVWNNQSGVTEPIICDYKVHQCFVYNLMAFWDYTLKIEAKNSAGNITSRPIHVKTKPKPPGMVQKVKVNSIKPRIVEIYWDQPSLLERNGEIKKYIIHYFYRHDKELINETLIVKEILRRLPLTIEVHPEVDFTVTIKAVNQAGPGQGITKIKKVPAFRLPKPVEITPMIRKSYNHPVTDSKRQISIELPLLFLCNDSYGSIQESGIIATRDIDNTGKDPLEHTDPKFHPRWSESINSKSILSYRVTDTAWNSYCILRDTGATRSKTIDYVVGADRNCENKYYGHCNGYLTPETIYRFKVFVCTSAGCTYSDYSKQMETEAEESSTHLLAICVIIALLLIVVSAVFGYIVYRKRSRCGMDKDESKKKEANDVEMCVEASRNRPVKLASFDQHVAKLHQDSNLGFSEEYKAIKRLSNKYSTKAAERESCRIKNRYTNVLPYDQTRVKLLPVDDEDGSEYINANFLPGYNSKREYIAAQGPLPATLDDFWRMIWEHHVTIVVMLTQCSEKGTTKCERYWPETNEPIYFGDLIVRMRSESVLPDYVIRIIDVQLGIKKRTIKQFHFLKWPDFGCPEKTWLLLNFVTAVRSHISNSQNGPILAHCSAGVGRTGTFIAVDILLQKIRETDEVDIFNLVLEMRENRPLMVQTENQYIYVHDCIRDALMEDTDDEESMSEPIYENQIIYENT